MTAFWQACNQRNNNKNKIANILCKAYPNLQICIARTYFHDFKFYVFENLLQGKQN